MKISDFARGKIKYKKPLEDTPSEPHLATIKVFSGVRKALRWRASKLLLRLL